MRLAAFNLVVPGANGVDTDRCNSSYSHALGLDRALLCSGRGAPPAP
jgi:hypothetical protein